MTDLENDLIWALRDMVRQHCNPEEDGSFTTDFLSYNKKAMQLLVKVGAMEEVEDGYGRNYNAKFIGKYME